MTLQETPVADERFLASGDEAGTAPDDRRFRPDVEGLRAVAVLLVVLYHAGVRSLPGGFIGVDVFFVISGFVITGLLLRERQGTRRTSILDFYARRVRRILPAATLVILVTVLGAYVVLGVVSGNTTADDGRWAAAFLANLHFEAIGTNYLSAFRLPSPLQNYWSLSVEEQFYVVYPTLFLLVAGIKGRLSLRIRMTIALGIVIVASYSMSIVQTASHPTAAYFSPFTRAWELALGALVAVATSWLKHLPAQIAELLTWGGLAGIFYAAVAFNAQTPYPGSLVAVPVIGAALVIAGGVANPKSGAESLLGLQPFQWLGKRSYSLYLWHWPILIIAAETTPPTHFRVIPAANTQVVLDQVAAATKITTVPKSVEQSGFGAYDYWGGAYESARCQAGTMQTREQICNLGDPTGSRLMVVYGDSHALMWIPPFKAIARAEHWRLVVLGKWACPAVPVTIQFKKSPEPDAICDDWHTWATKWINQNRPSLLVFSQADFYSPPAPTGSQLVPFTGAQWQHGLDDLFNSFKVPNMRMVLLGTTPILPQVAPVCLAAHPKDVQKCSSPAQSSVPALSEIDRSAALAAHVQYIDTIPWFCSSTCTPIIGDHDVYDISGQHVSGSWVQYLQNVLQRALAPPLPHASHNSL